MQDTTNRVTNTARMNRRKLLAVTAGTAASAGLMTEIGGAVEDSSAGELQLENETVTLQPPTSTSGIVAAFERDRERYVEDLTVSLRDRTESSMDFTSVERTVRSNSVAEVTRLMETEANEMESVLRLRLLSDHPAVVLRHKVTNTGDDQLTIDTPDNFIGTDIGLGESQLYNPGENYRFSVLGEEPVAYDSIGRWVTFDLPDTVGWMTSFDDQRAVSYGLDGEQSTSDPNLAMTESDPPTQIRLFGTAVTLDPGESAEWRSALAIHDGGDSAPETGSQLIQTAFETEPIAQPLGELERTDEDSSSDDDGAGFGVVSALAAVGGAGYLLGRKGKQKRRTE